MSRLALPLLLLAGAAAAANLDGTIDPGYGETAGRTAIGYMDYYTPDLRAAVRYPSNGQTWLLADNADDPAFLYVSRLLASGIPDPAFGPNNDGRRRVAIPSGLTPYNEGLRVHAAAMQSPQIQTLFAGGLYATDGDVGAYPGIVCRLQAAGGFDPSFDDDGCQTLRSFLAADEICEVSDIAVDPNSLIIAVGNCSAPSIGTRPFIARLTANGEFDTEFNGGIGMVLPAPPLLSVVTQEYRAVVAIPDGRIAVLGDYVMTDTGVRDFELGIAQFDNGGGYDLSFNGNGFNSFAFDLGGDNHDRARDLALRANGRLLALGESKRTDLGTTTVLMAQVLTTGLPDGSFGVGGKRIENADGLLGQHAEVRSLEIDNLDRMVISAADVSVDERANSHQGTDFRFSFIYGVPPMELPQFYITAETAANGTISSPGLAQPIQFQIQAGGTLAAGLPTTFVSNTDIDMVASHGLQISSDAPITVVARSGREYSADASVVMPTEHLGRRYRISSWGIGAGGGSTFSIVAVENDTVVTITPSITAQGHPAGVPYQVTLDANQSYWTSTAQATADYTGTTIIADKPVSVTAGHTCAAVPDNSVGNCENIFEQQLPIERWGTQFFATRPTNRPHGMLVRVLADHSPTLVWFDGALVATLQAGQTFDSIRTTPTTIVTSHPAMATEVEPGVKYMTGVEGIGDPSLLVLEPISRWSPNNLIRVLGSYGQTTPEYRMRIVAPTSVTSQVMVNNQPVAPQNFTAIGTSGYAVADIATGFGRYRVDAPLPIWVSASTRDDSESTALNAAVMTANPSADDLLLRLMPNGLRDTQFGANGLALIDHTAFSGGNQNSHDRIIRALPVGDAIYGYTDFTSPVSQQHLPMVYRLIAGALFRDGFE